MFNVAKSTEAKFFAVLYGSLVFFLVTPVNLVFSSALIAHPIESPIWYWPMALVSFGVGGWIAGRRVPAQPVLYGFMAGILGTLAVTVVVLSCGVEDNFVVFAAGGGVVGSLMAAAGGWFGAVAAPRNV